MKIVCPECRTVYRIDANKIPARNARTRCKKCGSIIPIVLTRTKANPNRQPSDRTAPVPSASPPPPVQHAPQPEAPPVFKEQPNAHIGSAGRRFAAFSIDAIIVILLSQGIFFLFGLVMPAAENWQFAGTFILVLIYSGLGNSAVFNGRTIGKRILGIRTQNGDGSSLTWARSVIRAFVMAGPLFGSLVIFPICELGNVFVIIAFSMLLSTLFFSIYLLLFNSGTRQLVHDLAIRTYVVTAKTRGRVRPVPLLKWHAAAAGILTLLISLAVFFIFPVGGLS